MDMTPPPRRPGHGRSPWSRLFRSPGAEQRARLYEELATLLNAGIDLRAAVGALETQAPSGTARLVATWRASVMDGAHLWEGMERQPDVFGPLEVSLMRIGERSGRLVEALRGLAARLENERKARLVVLQAIAYPVLVMHVALCLPTIPLIGVRYGAGAYFTTVLIGLIVIWGVPLSALALYASRRMDPAFSRRVCRLPLVGPAVHHAAVQRFAWTLGLLHDTGENADIALEEAAQAADCGWFRARLSGAVRHITDGNSLAEAVNWLEAIPTDVRQMIANGERSGSLAESMERAGTMYEERAARSAKTAAVALGALAFGTAVLFVIVAVLGVMGPYYATLFELAG